MDRFVTLDEQGQFYSVCTFCRKKFSQHSQRGIRAPKTSLSLLLGVLLNGHSLNIIRGRHEKKENRRREERERKKEKGDRRMTERKNKKRKRTETNKERQTLPSSLYLNYCG